jgi:hypothetical protein
MIQLQIVGTIRDGLRDYSGLLPEDHTIKPERIKSLLEAGLLEEVEVVVKRKPKPKPSPARKGVWDLDPEGLVGMNLGRLNALIAEKGGTSKATDIKTAIKMLSKDFNKVAAEAKARKKVVVWEEDESLEPAAEGPTSAELVELEAEALLEPTPEDFAPREAVPTTAAKVEIPAGLNFVPPASEG